MKKALAFIKFLPCFIWSFLLKTDVLLVASVKPKQAYALSKALNRVLIRGFSCSVKDHSLNGYRDGYGCDLYIRTTRIKQKKKTYTQWGGKCESDNIELWSPFDGKTYTSKARMRDEARARGLIEIGNENVEAVQARKRQEIQREQAADVSKDVRKALQQLGY